MLADFLSDEQEATLTRLRRLEELLDRQFSIAGIRFGIDSIIGLVPVAGDLITGAIGLYIISEARRFGLSRWTLTRMYSNWAIDVSIGALPIAGDLFDLAFRSNTKNVRLLIAELEKRELKASRAPGRSAPGRMSGAEIVELSPSQKQLLKPVRVLPPRRS